MIKVPSADYLHYACALQVLSGEGFTDSAKNLMLLKKYEGDTKKVKQHYEIDSMLDRLKWEKKSLLFKGQLEDPRVQRLVLQKGISKVVKSLHRCDGDVEKTIRHFQNRKIKNASRSELTQSAPSICGIFPNTFSHQEEEEENIDIVIDDQQEEEIETETETETETELNTQTNMIEIESSSSSSSSNHQMGDYDSLLDTFDDSHANPFEPSYSNIFDSIDCSTSSSSPSSPSTTADSRPRGDRRLLHSLTRIEKKIKKLNTRRRKIEEKIVRRGSDPMLPSLSLSFA